MRKIALTLLPLLLLSSCSKTDNVVEKTFVNVLNEKYEYVFHADYVKTGKDGRCRVLYEEHTLDYQITGNESVDFDVSKIDYKKSYLNVYIESSDGYWLSGTYVAGSSYFKLFGFFFDSNQFVRLSGSKADSRYFDALYKAK